MLVSPGLGNTMTKLFLMLIFTLSFELHASESCRALWGERLSSKLELFKNASIRADKVIYPNFLKLKEDQVFVGANLVSEKKERFVSYARKYYAKEHLKNDANKFYVETSDPYKFFDDLVEIYHESGPINKLLLVAHGKAGSIAVGDQFLNARWAFQNRGFLQLLPRDLFAKNAEVIVLGCNCGQGRRSDRDFGVESMQNFFKGFIHQGALIRVSRRMVNLQINKSEGPMAELAHFKDLEEMIKPRNLPYLLSRLPGGVLSKLLTPIRFAILTKSEHESFAVEDLYLPPKHEFQD